MTRRYEYADQHALTNLGRTTGALNSAGARNANTRQLSTESLLTGELLTWHDGTYTRVAIGKHSDGKYGVRVWDSSGVLTIDDTTA